MAESSPAHYQLTSFRIVNLWIPVTNDILWFQTE